MPGYEVHAATLVDVPLVRRLADKGMILDSELCYTRSVDGSRGGVLSSILLSQRAGVVTLVGKAEKQPVTGQFRVKVADHLAQIVYVAPYFDGEANDLAWLALLDAMSIEAGKRGATMLTAEVDEVSPLFVTMRQAGFAVYARQEIWRRERGERNTDNLPPLSGVLADETEDDTLDIQLLYANIVPRLVQPIAVPSPDSDGIVYRNNGRVQAYIAVSRGKYGTYLMPFMHPDVLGREAAAIIEGVIARLDSDKADHTPVYVCVRRYQDWLADTLRDQGFMSWSGQAVMVRHIAAGVRQPAFALPAKRVFEAIPTISGSVRHFTGESEIGEKTVPYGTTNHR
jgi:hypothetical protein